MELSDFSPISSLLCTSGPVFTSRNLPLSKAALEPVMSLALARAGSAGTGQIAMVFGAVFRTSLDLEGREASAWMEAWAWRSGFLGGKAGLVAFGRSSTSPDSSWETGAGAPAAGASESTREAGTCM